MKRNATAVWNGSGKEGNGVLTTQSTTLDSTQYSYLSRFESGVGTNPEELIAAALSGCYSMKLAFVLGAAGFTPQKIETKSDISLDNGAISASHINVKASVPNISKEQFDKAVEEAKAGCIIVNALKLDTTHEATLG